MKRIPVLLIVLLVSSMAIGQSFDKPAETALLEESFENDWPPAGWHLMTDFMLDNWTRTSDKARTGQYSAVAEIQYLTSLNVWMVTDAIDLSAASSATLYFYEEAENWESAGGTHYIKVSTTSQSQQSSFTTLLTMTPADHTIEGFDGPPVLVDLSAYAGESTVYIAFQYDGTDADTWYLDDIKVTTPEAHDVMAFSIDLEENQTPNSTIQPLATVRNVGANTETFDVHFGYYDWNDNPVLLDTETVTDLPAGDYQQVTFANYTLGNNELTYYLETELSGDMDASNDLVTKRINTFTQTKSMVLVEKGTGTWCQYCPGSANAVDSLVETYPNSVAVLEYHYDDAYETSESLDRIDYYGITGYPTAVFNGTDKRVGGAASDADWVPLYNDYEDMYENGMAQLTSFDLELTFIDNGSSISAFANTTYLSASYVKTNRLFYGLCESHIAEEWQGMDSLHFVFRKMYHTIDGSVLYGGSEPPYEGMIVKDTLEFTIPDGVVKENCELVAFIQEPESKEVKATAKVDLSNPISAIPDQQENLVHGFRLFQNYPNPFNPATTIKYTVGRTVETHTNASSPYVTLAVYNLLGQKIATLVSEQQKPGSYSITWDARNQPTGIYIYKLQTNNGQVKTRKMVLLK